MTVKFSCESAIFFRTANNALQLIKISRLKSLSAVPQGSVLSPTLFLVYINELPEQVICEVSLFADDTLIYQSVNSQIDQSELQADIAALAKWADTWCMSFNATKCSIMSFNQTSTAPTAL